MLTFSHLIHSSHTYLSMKLEQSVPKRRHIKFRRRGITQKKAYNIQNMAKIWNHGHACRIRLRLHCSQNRHNTANQRLSEYTLQERVATFILTCISRHTRASCSQALVLLIVWVVGSLQHSRTTSKWSTAISIHVRSLLLAQILYHVAFSVLADTYLSTFPTSFVYLKETF